jgi:predicted dehydrogenase
MAHGSRTGASSELTRREFVRGATATVAGAGLVLNLGAAAQDGGEQKPASEAQPAAQPGGAVDDLKIAIIGAGSQGRNLLTTCMKIPGVRFVAVCDIWPYAQTYAANILKKYDQPVGTYGAYQEMLSKEKDLDAVIVASPDWVHAEHAIACLKAGRHVYCEKEMSNTVESARQMVQTARDTKKLLQIGHQRRSNPRYWHAIKLIEKDKVLGRITHCYGQWNRSRREDIGWPKGKELDDATLKTFGYDTMERLCNWRWYKQYSGGPMADLGSHQVDVFNWVLHTPPKAVMASGGLDNYQDREWYDNVLSIYEYGVDGRTVRAFYQVLNTTSYGGFFEVFMGDEGSIEMSEDSRRGLLFREPQAKRREWEDESQKVEALGRDAIELKIGETLAPDGSKDPKGQALLEESKKPVHQLHLENFFNAIRTGSPLSCPAEVGFETCVSVLRANEAVEAAKRLEFTPKDFVG